MKPIPKILYEEVRERDTIKDKNKQQWYWKCRKCGGKAEHIHHIAGRNYIKPLYGIPDIQGGNHEYNLISLCSKCHGEIHQYGISDEEKLEFIAENKAKTKQTPKVTEFYEKNKGKLYRGELY
jgi:predicted HNH restriction endonuclease